MYNISTLFLCINRDTPKLIYIKIYEYRLSLFIKYALKSKNGKIKKIKNITIRLKNTYYAI